MRSSLITERRSPTVTARRNRCVSSYCGSGLSSNLYSMAMHLFHGQNIVLLVTVAVVHRIILIANGSMCNYSFIHECVCSIRFIPRTVSAYLSNFNVALNVPSMVHRTLSNECDLY